MFTFRSPQGQMITVDFGQLLDILPELPVRVYAGVERRAGKPNGFMNVTAAEFAQIAEAAG
jgi:hypothetical protein